MIIHYISYTYACEYIAAGIFIMNEAGNTR